MSEAIIVAIVTGAFASLVSLVSVILSSRLTLYRIQQLEKKVEKHNSVVERTALLERDQKIVWKRIDELKEEKKNV